MFFSSFHRVPSSLPWDFYGSEAFVSQPVISTLASLHVFLHESHSITAWPDTNGHIRRERNNILFQLISVQEIIGRMTSCDEL